ncbi:MAG TPA: phosphatidylglycerol lysyltransferase domain-containing protein, partial [Candidatus Saccharimonadales bacterium]
QDHGCPALVHQPEFSIAGVVGSELFHIDEEGDYDEYLIDASALTRLESPELGKIRRKIGRFERETQGRNIDISVSETVDSSFRDNILKAIDHWDSLFGRKNDLANNEGSAITYSLDHFSELGLRVLTLKVDGEIFGVCIYSATTDGSQYVLNHLRTDYSVPFINEFVTRSMAQVAVENSVDYLNLEMDLGIDNLRYHKANFRPARMLKQYQLTNN